VEPAAPDADLVGRCLAGDDRAWAELVDRYERYVHAIVTRGFGLRGADAEDAFQDAFTRVFERLGTLRDPGSLQPWIAQTTRRCCLDRIRSRRPETLVSEPEERAGDDEFAELDQALAVREALAALSGECAEVLDRFFCRDESYRTIGDALGLPAGTIASRISRCLEKLRQTMDFGADAAAGKKTGLRSVE
jgi:RNA polymerase sigma factor (sigma-70 family)